MDRPSNKESLGVLVKMAGVVAGLAILYFAATSSPVFQADPVTLSADDDAEMNAAIAKAKETLPQFIDALSNPKSNQSSFSLKMAFRDAGQIEHMFVDAPKFSEGKFTGRLANTPQWVKGLILGQTVEGTADDVSDWMFAQDGKLVGGYVLKLQLARYSPEEREILRLRYPFVIED